MKILVVGGGGREHAICAQLKKSKRNIELFCAPGNAGIEEIATCVPIGAREVVTLTQYAVQKQFDLVFVAPDDPLALGLVDRLESAGIRAFGPRKNAAIIEASKSFSKEFMKKYGIPTAEYQVFDDFGKAERYLDACAYPVVLKADGLALGKGVVIAESKEDAKSSLSAMMNDKLFGDAGLTVVIEEFLIGKEYTVLAFCDGRTVSLMPASQDHKRAFDGDRGSNTGGMGAFCPTAVFNDAVKQETLVNVVYPTVNGLIEEGRPFKGVIYFGLMLTKDGVKTIEYNARFGDPETQVCLPLLKTDFVDVIDACIDGTLDKLTIEWETGCGFCVVAASGGYPGAVVKGYPIAIGDMDERITLFHSGTARRDGVLVTNGGRVLCVTTVADSIEDARKRVYGQIDKIKFQDMRYRTDIGIK